MITLPAELEAKIDEVKSWMFAGGQRIVARRIKVDESTVAKILNKKMPPNEKVLEAAIELMNERKAKFECLPKMKVA
jgi:hypothetical protein